MKILFAASEAVPYAASGGLADVAGALPKALRSRGEAARVVMPLYGDIDPKLREKMSFVTSFSVDLSWRKQYCGVFRSNCEGVVYYFIDNEYYFKRSGLYGYYDDLERFAFFSKAVLEMLRHIDFFPDVLHANDWQTGLIPVYLKTQYGDDADYRRIRTVFAIHNIRYQGVCGMEAAEDLFGFTAWGRELCSYHGDINLLKGGIEAADRVVTVSQSYAREILEPEFGYGLDPFLAQRREKITGILNGIDTKRYDPAHDPELPAHFSQDHPEGKALCKKALCASLGITQTEYPLVSLVTRLTEQKGLGLLHDGLDQVIGMGFSLAVLGAGDRALEEFFREAAGRYPGRVAAVIGFFPDLAKQIYAGSDFFLMPSLFEPCGLSQMIALRYGTIPVVRETGGLRDSIQDASLGDGNGFTFLHSQTQDMLFALHRARELYNRPEEFRALMLAAMRCDFSWGRSAKQYAMLYRSLML